VADCHCKSEKKEMLLTVLQKVTSIESQVATHAFRNCQVALSDWYSNNRHKVVTSIVLFDLLKVTIIVLL